MTNKQETVVLISQTVLDCSRLIDRGVSEPESRQSTRIARVNNRDKQEHETVYTYSCCSYGVW